jgi:hypothetical protein
MTQKSPETWNFPNPKEKRCLTSWLPSYPTSTVGLNRHYIHSLTPLDPPSLIYVYNITPALRGVVFSLIIGHLETDPLCCEYGIVTLVVSKQGRARILCTAMPHFWFVN